MDIRNIQQLIDHSSNADTMVTIAKTYIDGDILRDPVAAEAWLQRAIDANDPRSSPEAMGILATKILGREQVISDADYRDIRRRLEDAEGSEREELLTLLKLADESQKPPDLRTKNG